MSGKRRTKSAHRPYRRGPPWTAAEARLRLAHLLDEAAAGRPQRITRRGKTVAMLVGVPDRKRKPKETLLEFFMRSPLAEYRETHDLEFERNKDARLRSVAFDE
jgi:prevent-host-death family protein